MILEDIKKIKDHLSNLSFNFDYVSGQWQSKSTIINKTVVNNLVGSFWYADAYLDEPAIYRIEVNNIVDFIALLTKLNINISDYIQKTHAAYALLDRIIETHIEKGLSFNDMFDTVKSARYILKTIVKKEEQQ